jgi:hypothetical protein
MGLVTSLSISPGGRKLVALDAVGNAHVVDLVKMKTEHAFGRSHTPQARPGLALLIAYCVTLTAPLSIPALVMPTRARDLDGYAGYSHAPFARSVGCVVQWDRAPGERGGRCATSWAVLA